MASPIPIIYCHVGEFPRYLYCVLESARFFNPDAPIYLITDQTNLHLDALRVEVYPINQIRGDRLEQFDKHYLHVSSLSPVYTRICIERWFFIDELIKQKSFDRAVYLDSDGMLFHDVRESFGFISAAPNLLTSKVIGAACTYINKTVEPFLDLIIAKFRDEAFIESIRTRHRDAAATGGMVNLDDMEFLEVLSKQAGGALASYPNHLPIGHIDHCIFANDDGLLSRPSRRHISRKRVFWDDDGHAFRPTFRRLSDGAVVPTLMIHFQNGAKRKIRRFNRVGAPSAIPRSVRRRYYDFLLG